MTRRRRSILAVIVAALVLCGGAAMWPRPPSPQELNSVGLRGQYQRRNWPLPMWTWDWLPKRRPLLTEVVQGAFDATKTKDPYRPNRSSYGMIVFRSDGSIPDRAAVMDVLQNLPPLRQISVPYVGLTDADLRQLLAGQTELNTLTLSGNRITPEGLNEILKLPSPERLHIDCMTIPDADLIAVANAGHAKLLAPTIVRRAARRFADVMSDRPLAWTYPWKAGPDRHRRQYGKFAEVWDFANRMGSRQRKEDDPPSLFLTYRSEIEGRTTPIPPDVRPLIKAIERHFILHLDGVEPARSAPGSPTE